MISNELFDLQKRLQNLYHTLSARIATEEAELMKWNLGVEAWISCNGYKLGYSKISEKWHIVVKETRTLEDGKEEERIKPLLNSARGIRYSALKHFTELREEIFKEAQSLADKLEKALKSPTEEDDK